jgi:hypothetical protein
MANCRLARSLVTRFSCAMGMGAIQLMIRVSDFVCVQELGRNVQAKGKDAIAFPVKLLKT